MLTKKQIAAIHVAMSRAGITKERYRAILREVAGVDSSTDPELTNRDCDAILAALKPHRQGWQDGQLRTFRKYQDFCRITAQEARELLFRVTGWNHEESPSLTCEMFERVMAELETMLEGKIGSGAATLPDGVDLGYWRGKLPGAKITSRQVYEIELLWSKLMPYLEEEKRRTGYLLAILASACRIKYLDDVRNLASFRANRAIEALKARLDQEQQKVKDEIPF